MASVTQATAITQCNAAVDAIDVGGTGTLLFYTGTPPANVDASATGTLLGTLTFSATAFGAASTASPSVATANTITGDTSADATGDATYARAVSVSNGAVLQFTVAGSTGGSAEILITSADADAGIISGQPIEITSLTYSQPVA
tara:strand:- start:6094 stop:6525 length:432 start_codon:yes stop_codon:yes gene_type:complete